MANVMKSTTASEYIYSLLLTVVLLFITYFFKNFFSLATATLIFLLLIVFIAYRFGTFPALIAAIISFLYCDYFYIVPTRSLAIAGLQGVVTGIVFIVVSLAVGQLTVNLKRQIERANHRERITKTLYHFTQHISQARTMVELLHKITSLISGSFNLPTIIFLFNKNELELIQRFPAHTDIDKNSLAAAKWSWRNKTNAGKGTDTLVHIPWHLLLLNSAEKPVALLGLNVNEDTSLFNSDNYSLLQNLATQTANAIMRMQLSTEHEEHSLSEQTERLRAALLSSVSHDLKTPLVAIKGTISGLLEYGDHYTPATKTELLNTAYEETERLDRYINNLLQMTKLASGELALNRQPSSIQDIIGNAINITQRLSAQHKLSFNLPPELPLINVDAVMTEQVFVNLLSNAAKYSPANTEIKIQVMVVQNKIRVVVSDHGIGIAKDDLQRIFDLFYRAKFADSQSGGSGMGLTICKGILEAEGATIEAYSEGINRGSVFTVEFPILEKKTGTA